MSPPVQVAYTLATELGDSGINSNGGHYIPHAIAAPVPPPVKPRYPLVPPATGTKRMRPWDNVTTSEAITTHLSSAKLQSTTCEILGSLEDALEKKAAVTAERPVYFEAANMVLDFRTNMPRKKKMKILI